MTPTKGNDSKETSSTASPGISTDGRLQVGRTEEHDKLALLESEVTVLLALALHNATQSTIRWHPSANTNTRCLLPGLHLCTAPHGLIDLNLSLLTLV